MNINFEPMKKKPETPKVGVGVLVAKTSYKQVRGMVIPTTKLLLGKRKGSHGAGLWSLPGGHMELGEDFKTTCIREVKEETDIVIENAIKAGFSNNLIEKEGLHYVTLYFLAHWDEKQEPKLMEPNSCEGWKWFDTKELPDNIWENIRVIVKELGI